jgi:hypothetical protein
MEARRVPPEEHTERLLVAQAREALDKLPIVSLLQP